MKLKSAPFGLLLLAAIGLAACGQVEQTPGLTLTATSFDRLDGWAEDDLAAALPALTRSCARIASLPDDRDLGAEGLAGTAALWRAPCADLAALGKTDTPTLRAFLEARFTPWAVIDKQGKDGLFTGYYEAELKGSRKRHGDYQTPLLGLPDDLVMVDLGTFRDSLKGERIAGRVIDGRLAPYEDRTKIEGGALDAKAPVLAWVDDPVDAFFLQIQGSGRVRLDDGSILRVGYAGHNGHPYLAIGRVLIDRGEVAKEAMSMQAIRDWIAAHPNEGVALMRQNPAYVFFRELTGDGPIGAQGVALTPGRSLAIDRRYIPLGVPVWLQTTHPAPDQPPIHRLVVAQDTGGAIRGPVRGDLFWGYGAEAARHAGAMKQPGGYFLLLPRGFSPPPARPGA